MPALPASLTLPYSHATLPFSPPPLAPHPTPAWRVAVLALRLGWARRGSRWRFSLDIAGWAYSHFTRTTRAGKTPSLYCSLTIATPPFCGRVVDDAIYILSISSWHLSVSQAPAADDGWYAGRVGRKRWAGRHIPAATIFSLRAPVPAQRA